YDSKAESRHRLRQKPAAASDIEQPQPREGLRRARIARKMPRRLVTDEAESHRIELVQDAEFTARIPPFRRQRREPRDFGGIDSCLWMEALAHACGRDQLRDIA